MGKVFRPRKKSDQTKTEDGRERKHLLSKEENKMREIFQTIAGNVGMTYAELLDDKEFRNAVEKIMATDEYQEEHDNQTIKIAEGLKDGKTKNS